MIKYFKLIIILLFFFIGLSFASFASATSNVYYSVGQSTADLSINDSAQTCSVGGNCTVSISSGVATFNFAQTGNIGVGDVISADSILYYIASKTSTSVWNVITATGMTPADVSSASVTSIKHTYTSLNSAIASASILLGTSDLTSGNGYILNIPCYYDSSADTTATTVNGYTTDSTHYIKIYTPNNTLTESNYSQRAVGKWDTTKYRLACNLNSALVININNVKISGLQISLSPQNNGDVVVNIAASNVSIENNIIKYVSSAYNTNIYGIRCNTVRTNLKIWNNIIYGFNETTSYGIYSTPGANNASVYNNTIYGNNIGILTGNTHTLIKNNISYNNAIDYSGTFVATSTNNLSKDATAPAFNTYYRNKTLTFVNTTAGIEKLHLISTDNDAIDKGADLSDDSNISFSNDIDGDSRPDNTWDIGADEYYPTIPDTTPPVITNFVIPATSNSLNVSPITFAASDDVAVTEYCISETNDSDTCTWSATIPSSHLFSSEGNKILYAFARDESNNISTNFNDSVIITLLTYTIGGTLSGLDGSVILQNNGGDNLTLTADDSFDFVTALHDGSSYNVTVYDQPDGQICAVTNGSGTVSSANVSNIIVNCADGILYLDPSIGTVDIGSDIIITAKIDPGSNEVAAVELHVTFDSSKFSLSSIDTIETSGCSTDPELSVVLEEASIDNINGTASIIVGVCTNNPTKYITTDSVVATFIFHAISIATDSEIVIDSISQASANNETTNVVAVRNSASVTVTDVIDIIAPNGYSINFDTQYINVGNTTVASFSFTSAEVGTTYNYSIDDTNSTTSAVTGTGIIATSSDKIATIDLSSLNDGLLTLTASLKDSADNWGNDITDTIIKDSSSPNISSFILPANVTSFTVPVDSFIATDNIAITGYCLSEINNSNNCTWSTTIPVSYTFSTEGSKTLYAFTRDMATNISASVNASTIITIPVYTIGGVISGLSESVTLQNNSEDDLTLTANGSFIFATALYSSNNYIITVLTQPTGQTCTVTNGNGTITNSNINNVTVDCVTNPPVISDGSPSEDLDKNITEINLSVTTDKNATCKYATIPNIAYADMPNIFTVTGETTHSVLINNLTDGNTYAYYIRCDDGIGHANTNDYIINFNINPKNIIGVIKIEINKKNIQFKKTIYAWKKNIKIKGTKDTLVNGTIKIYKKSKLWKTIKVGTSGTWSKILKFKENFSGLIKIKRYDKNDNLISTNKAKLKIDTKKPIFNQPFPPILTKKRSDKVTFDATDDNLSHYRIRLLNNQGQVQNNWWQQNKDFYIAPKDIPNGVYILIIRAYDKAGNYTEERTTLKLIN
ncbi:MAG: hypothetical protein WC682_00670 [Parcubacteria group bacterium]|jgi:hypothetical protein